MISEELLKRVMNLKRIDDIYVEDNLLYFCELNRGINVYEFAHKCKEWLYDNFYKLPRASEYGYWHRMYFEKDNDAWFVNIEWSDEQIYYSFRGETEPEAIFKACEWIRNNLA